MARYVSQMNESVATQITQGFLIYRFPTAESKDSFLVCHARNHPTYAPESR